MITSGKKLRQKICGNQKEQQDLSGIESQRGSPSLRKVGLSSEHISHLANITYDRILKNKAHTARESCQGFEEFIDRRMAGERIGGSSEGWRQGMDVRDKRVLIPFESMIYEEFEEKRGHFSCDLFLEEVRDWLVEVIEMVTSISFNTFKKGELSLKEVKNFTSKNILLNIKYMFEKYDKLSLENRVELMRFVNQESREIFDHIMHKYPQNSGSSATKRVKSKVSKIDNRGSDEFEFLRNHGLDICYRENGDYTEDIMKVINKVISFGSEPFHGREGHHQTHFQVYSEIMESIFENAGVLTVSKSVEAVVNVVNQRSGLAENMEAVRNFANLTFKLGETLAVQESKIFEKKEVFHESSSKDYVIGQKIQPGTRQFSEEEIEGSIFKSHDTAILRILTKWAEQLFNKLETAQEAIYTRLYKFKDNKGKLINLNLDMRGEMYTEAREELKKAKEYFKYLRNQNVYLQTLFAGEINQGKYSKLDTKIGTFASKSNEIGSQYIFKHINKLIHGLLTVSRSASIHRTNKGQQSLLQSINLVTLKIGDLMRSKYSCSQFEFIKIMDILQQLHLKYPQILKIVRIKNRLERKDNDILVNLFWMNKIEVELQLSIQGNGHSVEKKYGDYCHLIYEITRARLGPVSEMCSIVCQLDPLARGYSRVKSYGPKLKEQHLTAHRKNNIFSRIKEEIALKNKLNIGNSTELPFICRSCRRLTILTNPEFLYREKHDLEIDCNECRFEDLQSERPLEAYQYIVNSSFEHRDEEEKQFIVEHISFWDSDEALKNLNKKQINPQRLIGTIPSSGLLMTINQKRPKLMLFSTAVGQNDNNIIFAHVDHSGNEKIITKLTIKHEKQQQIQPLKEQMKKLMIFQFKGTRQHLQDDGLRAQCFRSLCCGKTIRIGQLLRPEKILEISEKSYLMGQIESQKSVIRMNLVKDAFRKLGQVMKVVQERGSNMVRLVKSIEIMKAYKCGIDDTSILSKFLFLTEVNISDNYGLKELRGINSCRYLRSLDVRHCDLHNLDDLSTNIRLKYLNVSGNQRLGSLAGLRDHLHLVELIVNNTAISDLQPLNSCSSLSILDLQNCQLVESLNCLNDQKISFINTYGCSRLPQDPNQRLKNSILSKSHHLDLKRSTCSSVKQLSLNRMHRGFTSHPWQESALPLMQLKGKVVQFDPYLTGLDCVAKYFLTLMHDDRYPLSQSCQRMTNDGAPGLFKLFL